MGHISCFQRGKSDGNTMPRSNQSSLPLSSPTPKPATTARSAKVQPKTRSPRKLALDLDRHVPYFFTNISIRLSRGASRLYLKNFGIGITEWRVIASLVAIPHCGPTQICQAVGLDKSAVSRSLKMLEAGGYVRTSADPRDTRVQNVHLTKEGQGLHDKVIAVALERERILLSCLTEGEAEALISTLRKIREQVRLVNAYAPDAERGDRIAKKGRTSATGARTTGPA